MGGGNELVCIGARSPNALPGREEEAAQSWRIRFNGTVTSSALGFGAVPWTTPAQGTQHPAGGPQERQA
jgi:hypothetical protein